VGAEFELGLPLSTFLQYDVSLDCRSSSQREDNIRHWVLVSTMAVIAVAGGTGGVGKTLVERLSQESNVRLIVLTRSVSSFKRIDY
jgi:FlaA1/EpsC-like NDP-sugar epimerase